MCCGGTATYKMLLGDVFVSLIHLSQRAFAVYEYVWRDVLDVNFAALAVKSVVSSQKVGRVLRATQW